MITWLPQLKFGAAARRLDTPRLMSQIENAHNILMILEQAGAPKEQKDLEEVRMWQGYEYSLAMYALQMANEAVSKRSQRVDTKDFHDLIDEYKFAGWELEMPPWAGDVEIVRSHRSRLIMMDPIYYAHQFPGTPPRMPVIWPQLVKSEPCGYRLRLKTNDIRRLSQGTRQLPPHLYYDPNKNEVCKRAAKEERS